LEEISREERIFERDGVLRAKDGAVVGHCAVGVSLGKLTRALSSPGDSRTSTGAVKTAQTHLSTILDIYKDSPYILWSSDGQHRTPSQQQLLIVLKKHATKQDILVAWWQALSICCRSEKSSNSSEKQQSRDELEVFRQSHHEALELLKKFEAPLKQKGWQLEGSVLETVAGTRISVG
jgi:hypothetical protein